MPEYAHQRINEMTRYSAYIRNNGKNRKKTGIFLWHFSGMVAALIVIAGCAVSS